MYKVTIEEFYSNAPGAVAVFQKDVYPKAEDVKTIEDVKKLFNRHLVPAVVQAARANGCSCNDLEDHFWDVFRLREETANGDVQKFLEDVPSDEEFIKGFTNLARSYAMRGKCHTTTKHFICYCNEPPKKK